MNTQRVVLVTGGSRGVGAGIATALAGADSVIYISCRNTDVGQRVVEEIERRGGNAKVVRCDHADDQQVEKLFETIQREQGRLDILVNNVFIVHQQLLSPLPFWQKNLDVWDMVDVGLRSHYVAAVFAARIMAEQQSGLIVNTSAYAGGRYRHDVVYGLGKAGVDRMAADMAIELEPVNVAMVSLWMGIVKTSRTLQAFEDYPDKFSEKEMRAAESPEYGGFVINRLFNDPHLMTKSGKVYIAAELGAEYGVTDVDGQQPGSLRTTWWGPVWNP